MTPNQFYKHHTKERIEHVCKEAQTSMANFQQIAVSGGACGKKLAERLAKASAGEMTELEILYPERFQQNTAA